MAQRRPRPRRRTVGTTTPAPRAGRSRVAVRELRQNLSVHLRRVEKGETLEVTQRGRPVAILAPLPELASPLARLVAEGRVAQVATGNLADLGPPLRLKLRMSLSEALEEQRADRDLLR